MTASNDSRFKLVTAGHHFLVDVLPFRKPDSEVALTTFLAAARRIGPTAADLETVLLKCLVVLGNHATTSLPSLVDRYFSCARAHADYLDRFADCIADLLRFQGIRDGAVQEAIELVRRRYADAECGPQAVANSLGVRRATLDEKFEKETGCTVSEHIRNVRLEEAALLLATTNHTIKEVWTRIGYNHHSNFDKDFKKRFDCPPREYRRRALRPAAKDTLRTRCIAAAAQDSSGVSDPKASVLIVDDDEGTRTTVGRWLEIEKGHTVFTAPGGSEGLRQACSGPDVLLLDYRMEDMDGVEFLRKLRGHPGGKWPAVALFTADWDLLHDADEIAGLDAMVASKLCDLERVSDLVAYLSCRPPSSPSLGHDGGASSWRAWIPFL